MAELQEIIKGCVSGKRRSQEELFLLFSDKMFSLCLRYSTDTSQAEDILHEGFIKAFECIGQYRGEGSFEGWLRRIFITTALARFRKKSPILPVGDEHEFIEDNRTATILETLSADEIMELVLELTPKYRMVFNLYVIEGFNHTEIAEIMGISEGTSKSNLARARYILQEKIMEKFSTQNFNDTVAW